MYCDIVMILADWLRMYTLIASIVNIINTYLTCYAISVLRNSFKFVSYKIYRYTAGVNGR